MKKLFSYVMIGALCASFASPLAVSAADEKPVCSIPVTDASLPADDENRKPVDCTFYQTEGDTSNIKVTGRIFAGEADQYVDVYVPAKLTWYANMQKIDNVAPVKSPEFKIHNLNDRGNIQLTIKSFARDAEKMATAIKAGFVEEKLTLRFTGDLALSGVNLSDTAKNNPTLNAKLGKILYSKNGVANDPQTGGEKRKNVFSFGFDGNYNGAVPYKYENGFLPAYDMMLNIVVDSVEPGNK